MMLTSLTSWSEQVVGPRYLTVLILFYDNGE
jgi:hypothetical protein